MKKETEDMPQSENSAPQSSQKPGPPPVDLSKAGLSADALAKAGYKHTPLGWLPKEWEVTNIDKSCRILSGGTPKKDEERFWGGDIPWYSAKDLKSFFLESSIDLVTQEGVQNGTRLIPKGTILILVRGMMLNRDLPIGIVSTDSTFNQDLKALIPKKYVDVRYLAYSLVSRKRGLLGLVNRSSHGTGKIETSTLRSFKIPLPPLPEQQQIAAILSAWDRAIERTQALIAAKEERRRGVMQRLLTGKVRVKGFEGAWREVHLGDVFKERKETGFNELPLLAITADRGVIYRDELDKKDTSNDDKSKYKRICPGDIGYNTMRMWQGRSAVSSLEGIVSPAYTIVTPKKGVDVGFMGYLFQLPHTIHLFWRFSQGLVDDTLNCKFPSFAQIKVRIPSSYEEQMVISNILKLADNEIRLFTDRLEALKAQKKGLMQQLLTGKIRVGQSRGG